jgi:hypothetical protein
VGSDEASRSGRRRLNGLYVDREEKQLGRWCQLAGLMSEYTGVNRQFEMGSRKQDQQASWKGREEGCQEPRGVESTPGSETRM